MTKTKEKPTLSLLRGNSVTGETLAKLYAKLTGKTATKKEIADAQATLDAAKKK